MMRTLLALIAAFLTFYVVVSILDLGPVSLLLAFGAAIVVFVVGKGKKSGGGSAPAPRRGRYPEGFTPSFAHDNIAIDQANDRIWLRDRSGHWAILPRSDILRWNRAFVHRGPIEFDNRIEVHVRDLNRPKYEVAFKRHGEAFKWGAAKNSQEAEEWVSRLTTWVNNS